MADIVAIMAHIGLCSTTAKVHCCGSPFYIIIIFFFPRAHLFLVTFWWRAEFLLFGGQRLFDVNRINQDPLYRFLTLLRLSAHSKQDKWKDVEEEWLFVSFDEACLFSLWNEGNDFRSDEFYSLRSHRSLLEREKKAHSRKAETCIVLILTPHSTYLFKNLPKVRTNSAFHFFF